MSSENLLRKSFKSKEVEYLQTIINDQNIKLVDITRAYTDACIERDNMGANIIFKGLKESINSDDDPWDEIEKLQDDNDNLREVVARHIITMESILEGGNEIYDREKIHNYMYGDEPYSNTITTSKFIDKATKSMSSIYTTTKYYYDEHTKIKSYTNNSNEMNMDTLLKMVDSL